MKITENVVIDLLPAYLSGEASDDTMRLVKEYLKENPEFAKVYNVEQLDKDLTVNFLDTDEYKLLKRTKGMMKLRSWLFGGGIFFSVLPISFYGNETEFHWLWESIPEIAYTSGIFAICLWITYANIHKRLSVTGL